MVILPLVSDDFVERSRKAHVVRPSRRCVPLPVRESAEGLRSLQRILTGGLSSCVQAWAFAIVWLLLVLSHSENSGTKKK